MFAANSIALASVVVAQLWTGSVAASIETRAADPCAKIAGQSFVAPSDARACLSSFPYNATLAKNVMDVVEGAINFLTFEEWQKLTPFPFTEASVNLDFEFARIRKTQYKTDYEFNRDLFKVINRLDDGHTLWLPSCYRNAFQNILPAPVVALEKNGIQDIYIAPDTVEFISLLGANYTSYYDQKGFNWKKYAGAKVLTIEGLPAWAYVNLIATTESGNWVDHNIRVNSVLSSYRVTSNVWSQRLGDIAGALFPDRDNLKMTLIPATSGAKIETVTFDYRSNYLGAPFKDGPSYWAANCVAKSTTNGVDYRPTQGVSKKISRPDLRPIAVSVDAGAPEGIVLPEPYVPTQPILAGGDGQLKAYILPDNKTGVLMVGSFGGDYEKFQTDTLAALNKFKSSGVQQLIVDTTGNGGGYVCLGEFLINALAGTKFGYAGFESTTRANPLSRKIVAADIAQGIDYMFYSPNNWAFLNNTPQPSNYNYIEPPTNFIINGQKDSVSKRFYDICTPYDVELPAEPAFPPSKILIVGNGLCGSTCALFSGVAYERLGIKVITFGGNPGAPMNFNGLAGNQVLEWANLDSEIKTAGLKNDPLAPPDLLVNGNIRINWRYAWSWKSKNTPLAFFVERANIRLAYTQDTYNNPQNLWTFVAKTYFK
ncbi:peptidase family S41 protein [Ceratobasidium sp. AG-Ba]|nr:peptidase family S41 protein [Ceratobasidium sp. AG-Ba]